MEVVEVGEVEEVGQVEEVQYTNIIYLGTIYTAPRLAVQYTIAPRLAVILVARSSRVVLYKRRDMGHRLSMAASFTSSSARVALWVMAWAAQELPLHNIKTGMVGAVQWLSLGEALVTHDETKMVEYLVSTDAASKAGADRDSTLLVVDGSGGDDTVAEADCEELQKKKGAAKAPRKSGTR